LTSVQLDALLFTVFTLREGRIVHLRDRARRTEALSDGGLDYLGRCIAIGLGGVSRW
jgi:hypothetical protein